MTIQSIVRLLIAGASLAPAAHASVTALAVNSPEPASMIVLGASLMGLGLIGRRKRIAIESRASCRERPPLRWNRPA